MSAVRDEVRLKSCGFNSSFLTDFPCDFEQITSSFASVWKMEWAECSCITGTLWAWQILGCCGGGDCRSVESRQMCYCPSAAALAESCSGFPQDWVKRMFFLPPLYFHPSFFNFFFSAIEYTIWLFTGVDLESGCSLKDEGMWGCKTTRFSLIWILSKVDTLHILPHLTSIVSCGSP